jgi:hypothetical protein
MEENLKKKCPICRQENWLIEKNNDNNKIFPLNNILLMNNSKEIYDISDEEYKENYCDLCKIYKLIIKISKAIIWIILFWLIGILTIMCLHNNKRCFYDDDSLIWISLLIGLLEFFICWCCCCRNVNLIDET